MHYIHISFVWACHNGHKDVVKLLMEHSNRHIDLNARTNQGMTALMWACHNGHKDVVKLLLDNSDIDLNARNTSGMTAFMCACQEGHKDVVQLLLKHSEINFDTTGVYLSEEMIDIIVNFEMHQDISNELNYFIQQQKKKNNR